MGSKALEAQRLRAELVGLRVAPWHVSFGSAIERGMEVHVYRVLLRSYWFLCGLDVHHQLHSLYPLERILGTGPRPHLAGAAQYHGLGVGWQASLERDAVPWCPPRLPQRGGHAEPAWPLSWLGEGPWRSGRGVAPWPVEAKWRRRNADAEDPEEALFDDEAKQVKQIELQMEHDGTVPNCSKLFRPGCCEQ